MHLNVQPCAPARPYRLQDQIINNPQGKNLKTRGFFFFFFVVGGHRQRSRPSGWVSTAVLPSPVRAAAGFREFRVWKILDVRVGGNERGVGRRETEIGTCRGDSAPGLGWEFTLYSAFSVPFSVPYTTQKWRWSSGGVTSHLLIYFVAGRFLGLCLFYRFVTSTHPL